MKSGTGFPIRKPPAHKLWWQRVLGCPDTKLGWWSASLTAVFIAFFTINAAVFMPNKVVVPWRQEVLPFYGIAMLLTGLSAGVTGLIAIIRLHERSWLVGFAPLPGLWVLFMLLGEFLFPH